LLRQAASSQPHQAVAAANWNARRGLITAEHAGFARDAARDPAWLAYHDQHQPQDQDRFAAEAARRETWAAQTDTRLGEPARAQREQRLAQTIGQGVGPGRPSQPIPASPPTSQALNRYAAAQPAEAARARARGVAQRPAQMAFAGGREPAPPVQGERQARFARATPAARQAPPERAPRPAFAAAPAQRPPAQPAERPQAMARSAGEQGAEAAFRSRPAAPQPRASPPQAFHAPVSPAPAAHAAPPAPHPQAAAQPHPAPPQAHAAAPPQHGGDDKHH
jgi:hypothetical protein